MIDRLKNEFSRLKREINRDNENKKCYNITNSKSCENTFFCDNCDSCYRVTHCNNLQNCMELSHSSYSENSTNSTYLKYCNNCHKSKQLIYCENCYDCIHCVGSINLRDKEYYIFNKKYDKKSYFEQLKLLEL